MSDASKTGTRSAKEPDLTIDLDLWPTVAPLLDAALDLNGEQRAAYLKDVEDEAVRRELERYLRYQATEGGITIGELLARSPITDLPQESEIGPYRLTALLGSGGAGAVYRAVDVRAEKAVALKVIELPDSPGRADRIAREVRALGRLDHGAVARYLGAEEATVEAGARGDVRVLWIAMELVEGDSVVTFADQNGLDEKARADLLIQACEAVQHALGRGVLHRDLKPSNVMAGRDDADRLFVKVVDFGVSQLPRRGQRRSDVADLLPLYTCVRGAGAAPRGARDRGDRRVGSGQDRTRPHGPRARE